MGPQLIGCGRVGGALTGWPRVHGWVEPRTVGCGWVSGTLAGWLWPQLVSCGWVGGWSLGCGRVGGALAGWLQEGGLASSSQLLEEGCPWEEG